MSAPCDRIDIVADPTAVPPGIWAADCTEPVANLLPVTGGAMYLNNDGTCPCTIGPLQDCLIPVKETSWGRVKAIYQ